MHLQFGLWNKNVSQFTLFGRSSRQYCPQPKHKTYSQLKNDLIQKTPKLPPLYWEIQCPKFKVGWTPVASCCACWESESEACTACALLPSLSRVCVCLCLLKCLAGEKIPFPYGRFPRILLRFWHYPFLRQVIFFKFRFFLGGSFEFRKVFFPYIFETAAFI